MIQNLADTNNALNLAFLPTQASQGLLLTSHNGELHVEIRESFTKPIVIGAQPSTKIYINAHPRVHAHVVIDANHPQLDLAVLSHAHVHLYLHKPNDNAMRLHASVHEDAQLDLFELTHHANAIDRTIEVELVAKRALCRYFGLDQLSGAMKKSCALTIFHRASETNSEQHVRGIYADSSMGFFMGLVYVDKDAHGASAKQRYQATLLHKTARAHVLPQLKIFNPDITAAHGATIGELDADALFYLASRGIGHKEACAMLVANTAQEIIGHIEHAEINRVFSTLFTNILNDAAGARS